MPKLRATTLRQRHDLPELLDTLAMDPATLAGNLRDIRRFNRLLRWDALIAREVARLLDTRVSANRPLILDVGRGSGARCYPRASSWPRRGDVRQCPAIGYTGRTTTIVATQRHAVEARRMGCAPLSPL